MPRVDHRPEKLTAFGAAKRILANLFVGAVLCGVVFIGYRVFLTDIIQANPHRSASHALMLVPVFGPIFGLWFLVGYGLFANVLTVLWTGFLFRRVGRLPFRLYLVAIPVSWVATVLQYSLLPEFNWYTHHPDDPPAFTGWEVASIYTAFLTVVLIFTWWQIKRIEINAVRAEH